MEGIGGARQVVHPALVITGAKAYTMCSTGKLAKTLQSIFIALELTPGAFYSQCHSDFVPA